jgi:hypothetical protein
MKMASARKPVYPSRAPFVTPVDEWGYAVDDECAGIYIVIENGIEFCLLISVMRFG